MVLMTARITRGKRIAIVIVLLLLVLVAVLCLRHADDPQPTDDAVTAENAATNDARVAFLATFGWEVSEQPVQTQQVRVPLDPSEVFLRYNELQRSQGYDLSTLAGKTLNRYVYEVFNHPGQDETYYATVLVYQDTVVGGDICSSAKNGVMHGFQMPQDG